MWVMFRSVSQRSQEKKGGMFLVDCCRLLPEGQGSGSGKQRPVFRGKGDGCCQRGRPASEET